MNYNSSKELTYFINLKLMQKMFGKTNILLTRKHLEKETLCKKCVKTSINQLKFLPVSNLIFPLYISIFEKNFDLKLKATLLIKLNQFIFIKLKNLVIKFKFVFILYCFKYLTNINLNE